MSASDRTRLAGRTASDYADGGHRVYFADDLNAVAAVGNDIAATGDTIAAQYAGILAVAGTTSGIGWSGLMVPRNAQLGEMAFLDERVGRGRFVKALTGAATLVVADFGKVINCTGSSYTVTLPPAASAGPGWVCRVANNGSGTITVDGDGSETINGATTITIAAGASKEIVWLSSSTWIAV